MKKLMLAGLALILSLSAQAQENEKVDTLNAAIIRTDKAKREARTQTSIQKLDSRQLKRGFALLGSPDLVKTLQTLPGVASGTELTSGLFVRGGDGSDNLFLLDGVPLYQVSHVIGLFSSFNTDIIEEVDFYKGGFPARYGGRLSSVVDVSVKDGDFLKWKGTAALGLIDGRFQIEGPLIKNKTSINFGVRRTWLDIIKGIATPFVLARNPESEDMLASTHYDFGDFNLKLVHILGPTSKLSLSAYYGQDLMTAKMKMSEEYEDGSSSANNMNERIKWGNALVSLKWNRYWLENGWSTESKLYYTNYSSDIFSRMEMIEKNLYEDGSRLNTYLDLKERNFTRIHDFGFDSDWFKEIVFLHKIRMGIGGVAHFYDPYRYMDLIVKVNGKTSYKENTNSSLSYIGGELGLYIEDEMNFWDWLDVNIGLRNASFFTEGKAYNRLEPRMAVKAALGTKLNLKASYAAMNQFAHLVSACYIDLPTSMWMPSTSRVKPMHADQFVLGADFRPNKNWRFDLETFYKSLTHLYEYNGMNSFLPALDAWESDYQEGKGRAYGAELSVEYSDTHLFAAIYYTLSRSERFYPSYYYSWFPDRNDNLHKLSLNATYRFNAKFELYANWTYRTGQRITGASAVIWGEDGVIDYVYDMPNSYHLPDYHRLDLGFNWHRKLRSGHIRTLNISVYNAYNRLNPIFGTVEADGNKVKGMAIGIIPIIPTFSYSWKF